MPTTTDATANTATATLAVSKQELEHTLYHYRHVSPPFAMVTRARWTLTST